GGHVHGWVEAAEGPGDGVEHGEGEKEKDGAGGQERSGHGVGNAVGGEAEAEGGAAGEEEEGELDEHEDGLAADGLEVDRAGGGAAGGEEEDEVVGGEPEEGGQRGAERRDERGIRADRAGEGHDKDCGDLDRGEQADGDGELARGDSDGRKRERL